MLTVVVEIDVVLCLCMASEIDTAVRRHFNALWNVL